MLRTTRTEEILLKEIELNCLDREWHLERDNYRIEGRYKDNIPTSSSGPMIVSAMLVGVGFMVFWLSTLNAAPKPTVGQDPTNFMLVFGVFGLLTVVVLGVRNLSTVSKYDDAHERYQRKRKQLLRDLNRLRR